MHKTQLTTKIIDTTFNIIKYDHTNHIATHQSYPIEDKFAASEVKIYPILAACGNVFHVCPYALQQPHFVLFIPFCPLPEGAPMHD